MVIWDSSKGFLEFQKPILETKINDSSTTFFTGILPDLYSQGTKNEYISSNTIHYDAWLELY